MDDFRLRLATVLLLQSHQNACPRQPTLLSEHIQPALAHVTNLVRLRRSSSPVVGNEFRCRHSFAPTAIARSRKQPAQKPDLQRRLSFISDTLGRFRFYDLLFKRAFLRLRYEKPVLPQTLKRIPFVRRQRLVVHSSQSFAPFANPKLISILNVSRRKGMCGKNQRTGSYPANRCKLHFRIILDILQNLAVLIEIDHIKSRKTTASGNPSKWIQPESVMCDLGEVFHNRCKGLLNGIDEVNVFTHQTLTCQIAGAQLLSAHVPLSREAADLQCVRL